MKKTFKFFAAALAIVAAASCAKEIENDTNTEVDVPTVHMTFSATIGTEEDTKTSFASDKKVHWLDDDAIRVFYMSGSYLKLNPTIFTIDPMSNDDDPTFADFSGDIVPSTSYYAAYPGNGWNVQNGATMDYLCFDGLRSQNAVLNSFDPEKHISLSVSLKDNHFYFQNACALAKIKIASANVYSVKIDGNVTSTGNGTYTEGSIGGDLWFKPGSTDLYRAYKKDGHNSILLSNADGSALQNGGTYYVVLPACKISNFKVTLFNNAGEELHSISKASEFNVERNKVYNLGEIKVPNKYQLGKQLTKTTELSGDVMYIVLSNSDKSKCWTNSNNSLTLSSPGSEYGDQHVFMYYPATATGPEGEKYASDKGGRWQSVSTNKIVTESLQFTADIPAQGLLWYMGNQWDGETGYDFDFYKNNSGSTLYHSGNNLYWGTTSNSNRKWLVYEAKQIQ